MKHQTSLFENSVRVSPLENKEINRIFIKEGQAKEYLTKSGNVIIVEKITGAIQGVSFSEMYCRISDRGKVLFPLTSKGVLNYIRNN